MGKFPKYIIEDGQLIIAKATYHTDMVKNPKKVQGGGWYHLELEERVLYLYSSSHDFGSPTLETIKEVVASGFLGTRHDKRAFRDWEIRWTTQDSNWKSDGLIIKEKE